MEVATSAETIVFLDLPVEECFAGVSGPERAITIKRGESGDLRLKAKNGIEELRG
jgi:hypothetical protein